MWTSRKNCAININRTCVRSIKESYIIMKKKKAINKLNYINRQNKEQLLKYLINLEKQENSYSQELVFAFPQKDD